MIAINTLRRVILILLFTATSSMLAAKPYVVGDLMGQLGNQFFQIAAATSLAIDNEAIALFPALVTEKDFNIPLNYEKVFPHLNTSQPDTPIESIYIEPQFRYSKIPYHPNLMIRGWFQSEKYFKHHQKEIMGLFAPSCEISCYLFEKYEDIISESKTVAIHYRSYKKEDPEEKVYIDCGLDYIRQAIEEFPMDSLFVVFSNDIEWCKENLPVIPRAFCFIEGEEHYHDFYLMSLCQHQIISNSSFSWWAAYLNKNPNKKVIAPANWFNPAYKGADPADLIPPEWICL